MRRAPLHESLDDADDADGAGHDVACPQPRPRRGGRAARAARAGPWPASTRLPAGAARRDAAARARRPLDRIGVPRARHQRGEPVRPRAPGEEAPALLMRRSAFAAGATASPPRLRSSPPDRCPRRRSASPCAAAGAPSSPARRPSRSRSASQSARGISTSTIAAVVAALEFEPRVRADRQRLRPASPATVPAPRLGDDLAARAAARSSRRRRCLAAGAWPSRPWNRFTSPRNCSTNGVAGWS